MACSSSGLGRRPLKAEITGSNPVRATNTFRSQVLGRKDIMFNNQIPSASSNLNHFSSNNANITNPETIVNLFSDMQKLFSAFTADNAVQTDIPLSTAYDLFFAYAKPMLSKKTYATHITTRKYFTKFTNTITLSEVTPQLLQNYFTERLQNSSIYQARKDRINLHAMFTWLIKNNLTKTNPVTTIKPFKAPEKLPKYLTKKDAETLISSIESLDLRDIVTVALHTGMRQNELITLRRSQIEISQGLIILTNQTSLTKSRKVRSIPMNAVTREIIQRRLADDSDLVFTLNKHTFTQNHLVRIFKAAIKKAGINPAYSFHSLRHTFASWLVLRGIPIFEIMNLLGHSDIKTTMIYAHLSNDRLRNAVAMLE